MRRITESINQFIHTQTLKNAKKLKPTSKRQNIYIMPTKFGFVYTGILFSIFLIGLTYTNNLTLIVAFWMLTVFLIQMLKTHRIVKEFTLKNIFLKSHNESDKNTVTISSENELEMLAFDLHFDNDSKRYICITEESLDLKRGYYEFDKLKVKSFGAMGLFYSWKYISIDKDLYIYPLKKQYNLQQIFHESNIYEIKNEDEFKDHKPYNNELPAKRIDWKVYAKTDELYWKNFESPNEQTKHITLDLFSGDIEEKLRKCNFLIEQLYKSKTPWSLSISGEILPEGISFSHFEKSLKVLARYK